MGCAGKQKVHDQTIIHMKFKNHTDMPWNNIGTAKRSEGKQLRRMLELPGYRPERMQHNTLRILKLKA